MNKPFNYHNYLLNERRIGRLNAWMLRLNYELLNNNSVLDLYHRLHFYFKEHDDGEFELRIDEYSQSNNSRITYFSSSPDTYNINEVKNDTVVTIKKKSYTEMLGEALDIINEIEVDVV